MSEQHQIPSHSRKHPDTTVQWEEKLQRKSIVGLCSAFIAHRVDYLSLKPETPSS